MLFEENFIHLCCFSEQSVGHTYWKCFRVLIRNVAVSKSQGQTNSTHSCLDYAVRGFYALRYLISIRVWGIASFYLTWVLLQPLMNETEQPHTFYLTWVLLQPLMNETEQPHTFFLYKSVIWGWWHKFEKSCAKKRL